MRHALNVIALALLVVLVAQVAAAHATTTRFPAAGYSYDRVAPNIHGASASVPSLFSADVPPISKDLTRWSTTAGLADFLAAEEEAQAVDITFGHGARHLVGTGLRQSEVEARIGAQVEKSVLRASSTGSFWGRVSVGGQTVEYRAYTLPSGTINFGTYYVAP